MTDGDLMNTEPPRYTRCRDCYKQYERQFIDDTGLCTMCRMPILLVPPNPIFDPATYRQ